PGSKDLKLNDSYNNTWTASMVGNCYKIQAYVPCALETTNDKEEKRQYKIYDPKSSDKDIPKFSIFYTFDNQIIWGSRDTNSYEFLKDFLFTDDTAYVNIDIHDSNGILVTPKTESQESKNYINVTEEYFNELPLKVKDAIDVN
ncbi:MAG: hypothetical protein GX660_25935, partial [Clostridiaceae bacterium]|nr:hypothetical protein [Clostridiaceae bacterium]